MISRSLLSPRLLGPSVLGLCVLAAACSKDKPVSDEPSATPQPQAATDKAPDQPATASEPATQPADIAASEGPGKPAPDFTLTDLDGKELTLSSLRGKVVVLEWFNPGCPFVKQAHGDGALKDLAARHQADGVTWVAINSGAEGKQGHGIETNKAATAEWKMNHPVLIDESGAVGKAYGAKTTPHMYIIDAEGNLAYEGGLDNAPLGKAPEGGIVEYVNMAIEAIRGGRTPDPAKTKSYGCSVKYAS